MKKPLLYFKEVGKDHLNEIIYYVYNHEGEFLGVICKSRVGRFLHWIFQSEYGIFYTNGCLKEIVEFMTSLYSRRKNEKRN
jgi:hypothetical protein